MTIKKKKKKVNSSITVVQALILPLILALT